MKKIFLISITMLLVLTGCGNNEEQTKDNNVDTSNVITQNSNDNVIKRQEVNGIIFDNVVLKTNNNMSFFNVNVTNNNSVSIDIKYIKVTAYDNSSKQLFEFNNYIGDSINPNQTLKLSSNIEGDLTNIYSIKYEIIQ